MADRGEQDQALFERSGRSVGRSPLVSFLYDLMRDHLPAGVVERLVRDAVVVGEKTPHGHWATTYTNGWLAEYAKDLAARLTEGMREVEPYNERDTLT